MDGCNMKTCTILSRSKIRKVRGYYKIGFEDGSWFHTYEEFLRKIEVEVEEEINENN